jgi:DNA-binding IclR family transcriptional regulator
MSDPRRAVLSALAAHSDADGETTTVATVAAAVGLPEAVARRQITGLVDCDLARETDEGVRMTVTAEQLLALDLDGPVVIDPD